MSEVCAVEHLRMTPGRVARRSLAILAGVVLVALGAQLAVPIPGTVVPMTFQVPAVLIVGGLLGPRMGAASLVVYLMLGAAGLAVFAPTGMVGFARLLGPTGGYLLAFPAAAAFVGVVIRDATSWLRIAAGLAGGLIAIHLGGIAQLAILTGGLERAVVLGSVPFLAGDLIKLVVAGLIVRRFGSRARALL
ncbi:MAG: biotin transporter BioY [Gemmatimonadales bacterium]